MAKRTKHSRRSKQADTGDLIEVLQPFVYHSDTGRMVRVEPGLMRTTDKALIKIALKGVLATMSRAAVPEPAAQHSGKATVNEAPSGPATVPGENQDSIIPNEVNQ